MLPIMHRVLIAVAATTALSGCAVLGGLPASVTTQDRLAMIPAGRAPVERPVTIYWSKEQIPYIDAQTDHDAAVALGIVHAHLRLGQLEVLRRVSQGRISEMTGPFGDVQKIDQMLRLIDFGRASKEIYANMAPQSKAFLDAFVAGLNYYQQHVKKLPGEYALLGIGREPWKPEEIITLGRLASIDVSWLLWLRLMPLRDRADWPQLWAETLARGTGSAPAPSPKQVMALQELSELLGGTPRTGSNSFAVGGAKTKSGAAIIASDPHLGLGLPNMWLVAGFQSPSYHTVGFMIPGLPFVAEGRNETIAWGGTNLRSAASDLIDISKLPPESITSHIVETHTRWWFDHSLTLRDSPYGPVISDADLVPKLPGEAFALKWIGHLPSDEFSAMLGVNRAKNWNEFRSDLDGFAISAQNFVYADTSGNVGQLVATHVPDRPPLPPADIVLPSAAALAWNTIHTERDLPQIYNPPVGFVASANDKPSGTPFPIGYFFDGDDRILRMREVLSAKTITVDDLKTLQRDTYMASAARLRDALVNRMRGVNLPPPACATLDAIAKWDARYDVGSKGAVAFQATVAHLVPHLASDVEIEIIETGGSEDAVYAQMIEKAESGAIQPWIVGALIASRDSIARYPTWGDMHVLELHHAFSEIPVIGGRYHFGELPWPGSNDTIWRAGHDLSADKVTTDFGSEARHISDLSDLDSNWFALLGGNDGWINSANFIDEVEAFRTSNLIQVPMRIETVRARFPYRTDLTP